MEYCCSLLETFHKDPRLDINYDEVFRRYYIHLSSGHDATQGLFFCPWCGQKLPKELSEEYYDSLWKIFGEDVDLNEIDLPDEFKSSQWWKNRNL